MNAPSSNPELVEARREARVEATVFVGVALVLLILLAAVSLRADWELLGLRGWVWLILCIPEVLLIGALVALLAVLEVEEPSSRADGSRTTIAANDCSGSFSAPWWLETSPGCSS